MITITISARAVLLAALLCLAALFTLYVTDALGSGDTPDSILQGDTDCDGDVDAQDALNDLRYVGGLDVGPFGGCPEIGTLAAIPGPQGPEGPAGPQGPQGPQGPTGVSLFASVNGSGDLLFGTATGVTILGFHTYVVSFDRDISECAAVAAPGVAAGSAGVEGSYPNALIQQVSTATVDDSSVSVLFIDADTYMGVDTDFHLIVAC